MGSGGTAEPTSLQEAMKAIANLQRALESRALIACAQGILMERHGLQPDAAMALLKRVSMERGVKVRLLAERMVAGENDLADPRPPPPHELARDEAG